MLGRTHMAGGAAAALAYTSIVAPDMPPHMVLCAAAVGAVGALIPDIDKANSLISRRLKPISFLVRLVSTHRGIFHTVFSYLLLFALWLWRCPQEWMLIWGNIVFVGILSHLVLDIITPMGIPVFFPFELKHRHLIGIPTGGAIEMIIRIGLVACTLWLLGQNLLPWLQG